MSSLIEWQPFEEDGDAALAQLQPEMLKHLVRLGYALWKTHGGVERILKLDGEACREAAAHPRIVALELTTAAQEKELGRLQHVIQQRDQDQLQQAAAKEALHGTVMQCLQAENDRLCVLLRQADNTRSKTTIGELQQTVCKQQEEIARLRNSNSGKGNLGEGMLESLLRSTFPANEIKNTGAVGHSCDISMADRFGRTVVFESKNRLAVSREDVGRFRSDVRNMHDSVGGAVFVSLRCPNIPGLGSMAVEVIGVGAKTKVLLYVGYNSLEEFERTFVPQVRTFWCLCGISHHTEAGAAESQQKIQDMVEDMRYYMSIIQRNQKSVKHLLLTLDADFSAMLSRMQCRLHTCASGAAPVSPKAVGDDDQERPTKSARLT